MQTQQSIEALYAQRNASIERLARAASITAEDLHQLDRLGRYLVASELWTRCDKGAKAALLNDQHAHVRSAASIATRSTAS